MLALYCTIGLGCNGGGVGAADAASIDASTSDSGTCPRYSDSAVPCCVENGDCVPCNSRPCIGCPGELRGVNCIPPQPDGGVYGGCIEDGEVFEAKVLGAYCCNRIVPDAGLRGRIAVEAPGDAGAGGTDERGCVPGAPVSAKICSPCGDGICEPWENRCNCPEDCR